MNNTVNEDVIEERKSIGIVTGEVLNHITSTTAGRFIY